MESLHKILGHIACVTDKDAVVAITGRVKKHRNERISSDLERLIHDKKVVVTNRNQQGTIHQISENEPEESEYTAQVIAPIVSAGEPIGAVILLSKIRMLP